MDIHGKFRIIVVLTMMCQRSKKSLQNISMNLFVSFNDLVYGIDCKYFAESRIFIACRNGRLKSNIGCLDRVFTTCEEQLTYRKQSNIQLVDQSKSNKFPPSDFSLIPSEILSEMLSSVSHCLVASPYLVLRFHQTKRS